MELSLLTSHPETLFFTLLAKGIEEDLQVVTEIKKLVESREGTIDNFMFII